MFGREIEINRNVIERFLMRVRDYVMKHRKQVIVSLIVLVSAAALLVAGIIFYEKKEEWDLTAFEQELYKYQQITIEDKEQKLKELDKTVKSLQGIVDSSYWGYVNENGYYIIAQLYAAVDKQKDAMEYFLRFADESPKSFFAPLALNRSAIISESLGKIDDALKTFQRLESEYGDSVIADEICYNLGRIYQIKGEKVKAREYYNKIVSLYPRSMLVDKAKKRLQLIGLQPGGAVKSM